MGFFSEGKQSPYVFQRILIINYTNASFSICFKLGLAILYTTYKLDKTQYETKLAS